MPFDYQLHHVISQKEDTLLIIGGCSRV